VNRKHLKSIQRLKSKTQGKDVLFQTMCKIQKKLEERFTMKKMMKCLVLAIMVLTVAGTAWSWDFADHVKVAPGGQGDFLFYPYYLALNGGWETKVWVVNTSPNRSVVAHIAFYSARTSRDMLDFFIFLTPTDVWNGVIRFNPTTNLVELYSEDDSAMTDAGVFASKTNPLTKAFVIPADPATCQPNAEPLQAQLGYIKVVEQAHTDAVASTGYVYPRVNGVPVTLNSPPASKPALYEAFNDFLVAAGLTPPAGATGVAGNNPLVMDGINVLTGYLEFRNTVSGQDATVNATVLRDYDNHTPVGYGQSFGFSTACTGLQGTTYPGSAALGLTRVGCQAGPALDASGYNQFVPTVTYPVANFTCVPGALPACGCTATGLGCQSNSIGEVEAALAKDWVSMPYNSKTATLHFLTFPTKQTVRNATDCYYQATYSPFFSTKVAQPPLPPTPRPTTYSSTWDSWGCMQYQALNFDISEKSSAVTSIFSPSGSRNNLCGEVNYANTFGFDEGWAVYNFSGNALNTMGSYITFFDVQANLNLLVADAWYTGAPVIGTVLYFGNNGLTTLPASYADGGVAYTPTGTQTAADTLHYYYQYWDEANRGSRNSAPGTAASYDLDDTGCWNATGTARIACATPSVGGVLTGATGSGTIYGNKFSGNRPVIFANATKTTDAGAMNNVRVPVGTTITTNTALTVTGCTIAPCPAAIAIGTSTTAGSGDLFVTIPNLTTITSSAALTGADANMP